MSAIRIEETVTTSRDAAEVFAYLSDFSQLPDWDPGIARALRLDGAGPVDVGARFRVVASFLGREVPMSYRVVTHEPSRLAVLEGEAATLRATDRIEVGEVDGQTRVTWRADFALKGPLRLGARLMRPLFVGLGKKAMAGLEERLAHPDPLPIGGTTRAA